MNTNIAFLLLSCDKYYEMIDPFAELMNRFWGDCKWPKFAATNVRPYDKRGFTPILTGEDSSWSAGLKTVLLQLKERKFEYVFITLEDLFLKAPVDNERVLAIVDEFMKIDGNYIRFYTHNTRAKKVNEYFAEIAKGTPYRHNCVYALWKIDTLLEVLKDDENAWEFEKIAVKRSDKYDGFYTVNKSQFKILNTLIKGKWVPYDYRYAKRLLPNLKIEKPMMSKMDELKLNLKRGAFLMVHCAPTFIRKRFIK